MPSFVVFLAADEGFVNLDNTAEFFEVIFDQARSRT